MYILCSTLNLVHPKRHEFHCNTWVKVKGAAKQSFALVLLKLSKKIFERGNRRQIARGTVLPEVNKA